MFRKPLINRTLNISSDHEIVVCGVELYGAGGSPWGRLFGRSRLKIERMVLSQLGKAVLGSGCAHGCCRQRHA